MHPTRPARRLIDHLRDAASLDHDRVVGWGCVLLAETAMAMLVGHWSGVVTRVWGSAPPAVALP